MPFRMCPHCGYFCVAVSGSPSPRPCPHCSQPLRLASEGQLLRRAARIGRVMGKYGLRELAGSRSRKPAATAASRFRAALEELGPTFAKLGQILSTRPDLLAPEFVDELARLQDDVAPLTEAEVVSVMEAELGVPWEDVFETIDPQPLAAGTIGQVHRATLETHERVVVKVQRPTARDDILRDLRLLELFAEKVASLVTLNQVADIPTVVEHLSESLRRELDFREEAASIDRLRAGLELFKRLGAPAVFHQFSSERRQRVELRVELRNGELHLRERLPRERERCRHPQPVAGAGRHDPLEEWTDLELAQRRVTEAADQLVEIALERGDVQVGRRRSVGERHDDLGEE